MKKILSCGLGVDSTALAILCQQNNLIPDAIIFADTGGEKPETYHYKSIFEEWLKINNMPPLITVRGQRTRKGKVVNSLEEHCLVGEKLPDIAYGYKACSLDWKRDPVQKWVKQTFPDEPITYLISYNADERRRMRVSEKQDISFSYPLIDAEWDRLKCIKEIIESDLPIPCKSACFYCPSSKKEEVIMLSKRHPDLVKRAIEIERAAKKTNTSVKGLGRSFSWEYLIKNDNAQFSLFPDSMIFDCSCIEAGVNLEPYWRQFP